MRNAWHLDCFCFARVLDVTGRVEGRGALVYVVAF